MCISTPIITPRRQNASRRLKPLNLVIPLDSFKSSDVLLPFALLPVLPSPTSQLELLKDALNNRHLLVLTHEGIALQINQLMHAQQVNNCPSSLFSPPRASFSSSLSDKDWSKSTI